MDNVDKIIIALPYLINVLSTLIPDISTIIEDHANHVSFSENKALKLEKQEYVSTDNTWITDNRTERKKKRSYAEVVCNLKEVKMNDSSEEKTSSSQQRVNILENDNFGNVKFSDIYQDLMRDEESNFSRIVRT